MVDPIFYPKLDQNMKKKSTPKAPTPAAPAPAVAMIDAEKLAALANLTKRRLYQLANENKLPPPTNGQFPMLASIKQLFAFYQRDGEEIQKEKLKKLTAERQMTELKLANQQGRMMEIAEVLRQVHAGVGAMFEELERMEREQPPAMSGLSAIDVEIRLKEAIKQIKKNLTVKFQSIGK
jgi:hypothetical protein